MAPTTEPQQRLITRLRALLADEPVLREVAMFGGRSFMVDEKLVVSALALERRAQARSTG